MGAEKIAEIFQLESVMEINEELDWRLIDREFFCKNFTYELRSSISRRDSGALLWAHGFWFWVPPTCGGCYDL
jgi:hypothetical protein